MAGTTRTLAHEMGDDGRPFGFMMAVGTLVAGVQTVDIPIGWTPIGYARSAPGAGAQGNLTISEAAGVLTIQSDAATDVSTVQVLLTRGS
jgi:hypothetical protein